MEAVAAFVSTSRARSNAFVHWVIGWVLMARNALIEMNVYFGMVTVLAKMSAPILLAAMCVVAAVFRGLGLLQTR